MSSRRTILVHLILAFLLAGQAASVIGDVGLFPFAPYRMFAKLRDRHTVTVVWLVGVDAEGRERPIRNHSAFEPVRMSRIGALIDDPPRLREGLSVLLARLRARERGPRTVALRLVRNTWDLEPRAANLDRPRMRELLAEVRLP